MQATMHMWKHKWRLLAIGAVAGMLAVPASREVLRLQSVQVFPLSRTITVAGPRAYHEPQRGSQFWPWFGVRYAHLRKTAEKRADVESRLGLVAAILRGSMASIETSTVTSGRDVSVSPRPASWPAHLDARWRALQIALTEAARASPDDPRLWALHALTDMRSVRLQRSGAARPFEALLPRGKRPADPDPQPAEAAIAEGIRHAATGSALEPENGYWDVVRAYFLFATRRDEEALDAVQAGVRKRRFQAYARALESAQLSLYTEARIDRVKNSEHRRVRNCHPDRVRGVAQMVLFHALRAEAEGDDGRAGRLYSALVHLAHHIRRNATAVHDSASWSRHAFTVARHHLRDPGSRPGWAASRGCSSTPKRRRHVCARWQTTSRCMGTQKPARCWSRSGMRGRRRMLDSTS